MKKVELFIPWWLEKGVKGLPGKPVACVLGPLSTNCALLWGMAARCLGLLGFPGKFSGIKDRLFLGVALVSSRRIELGVNFACH